MRRVRVVRLRVNAAEKRKMGGCYESIDVSIVVPGASLRKFFVRNRGVGRTRWYRRARGRSHVSGKLTRFGSDLRFEPGLKLGIQLVKAGFHATGVGPTPILERTDGDSQFEFDGILGLKVTTAVAADDL